MTAGTPFAFSSGSPTGTDSGPLLASTYAAGAIAGWAIIVGELLDRGDMVVISITNQLGDQLVFGDPNPHSRFLVLLGCGTFGPRRAGFEGFLHYGYSL
jgi:hypothetical protein